MSQMAVTMWHFEAVKKFLRYGGVEYIFSLFFTTLRATRQVFFTGQNTGHRANKQDQRCLLALIFIANDCFRGEITWFT